MGKIGRNDMMSLTPIIIVDIFDVWGLYFMGPFLNSFGNKYIILCVNHVSKWAGAIPTRTNDSKVVLRFL